MEVQENGSTTAAPSSVAQEGLLVLPTPAEYVVLSQSQTVEAQQQTVETQIPTSSLAAGPVNNNRVWLYHTTTHSYPSFQDPCHIHSTRAKIVWCALFRPHFACRQQPGSLR